jgi:hypothetical protein
MYIITRDKYSEGIDSIPWIKMPNKSLKEDFVNKGIYLLGITNNLRFRLRKNVSPSKKHGILLIRERWG